MRRKRWLFFLPLLLLLLVPLFYFKKSSSPAPTGYWLLDASSQKAITHTSFPLSIGDEYIASDGNVFRIIRISQGKAYAKRIQ